MARGILKLVTAALAVSAAVTVAHAGGFSRGTADTDLIFEEGNFNLRAGVTYVSPQRKYSKYNADPNFVGYDAYSAYAIPSAAVKLNVTDDLRCAGTFTQPYGGATHWPKPFGDTGKRSEVFTISEFGVSCGYKFELAKGRAWLLGGLFMESFDYSRTGTTPVGGTQLDLNGTDMGYRIGAAYEVPEIALRAQLMYRSSTSYGADGTLVAPTGALLLQQAQAAAAAGNLALAGQLQAQAQAAIAAGQISNVPSVGTGQLPQSVELKVQSGIAPGWLAFGSVKWTDWSVLDVLNVTSATGTPLSKNQYYWKDGWTVQLGVGHAFTEKLSGVASLTWDKGVATGWDLSSDTWTVAVGGSYKPDMGGEVRLGTGLTYLTSASETQYSAAQNASVKGGWAIALGGSYKVNW